MNILHPPPPLPKLGKTLYVHHCHDTVYNSIFPSTVFHFFLLSLSLSLSPQFSVLLLLLLSFLTSVVFSPPQVFIPPPSFSSQQYPSVVVSYCLKAMQHGSRAAAQQVPRMLQLLELHPDTLHHFKKKVFCSLACQLYFTRKR